MRILALLAATLFVMPAHAQSSGNWLDVSYTYTDFTYKEEKMSEKAQLAGVRGEVGFSLGPVALSVGGEYQDGHLHYDGQTFGGTPVQTYTNDYMRDLRATAHLVFHPFVLSVGVAQRYWYDDLVISYRRRTQYDYMPVQLTYQHERAYIRFEHDIWKKGSNTSHMSDVNPAAQDVTFTLGDGSGFGVEIGYEIPSQMVPSHIFARYHRWSVKQSDVQSDGTQLLVEPDNTTTIIQGGIGLSF